jgi:hypothetical protein
MDAKAGSPDTSAKANSIINFSNQLKPLPFTGIYQLAMISPSMQYMKQ